MAVRTPLQPKRDYLVGVSVMKCKGCRLKFVSYGKSLCSYCLKEK